MPNPNAIVSRVANLRTPGNRPLPDSFVAIGGPALEPGDYWIDFADGQYDRARLDGSHPRFECYLSMIADLERAGQPVYFEVSAVPNARRAITRVAPVRVCRVLSVGPLDAHVTVYLSSSHVDHVLRSTAVDFELHYEVLKRAEGAEDVFVCVSESATAREIYYAALAPPSVHPFGGLVNSPRPDRILQESELISQIEPIAESAARDAFHAMSAMTCEPVFQSGQKALLRPPGCTPFTLPDDGCHARAHHMCERLTRDLGITAAKVWLHGQGSFENPMRPTLRPESPNHPRGFVQWTYHVAPVIRVRFTSRDEWRVIDPSLATTGPLPTPEAWARIQNDPNAQLSFSQAAVFDQVQQGVVKRGHYDPDFLLVPKELAFYRNWLRDRVDACGAPPYR